MSDSDLKANILHRLPETPGEELGDDLHMLRRKSYQHEHGSICVYCLGSIDAGKDDPNRCMCGETPRTTSPDG